MENVGRSMKIGDLIKIHHSIRYGGQVGVLTAIQYCTGFVDTYCVFIPSFGYEVGLSKEQCEVISEKKLDKSSKRVSG